MPLYDNFKVAALPLDIAVGDITANLQAVNTAADSLSQGTDLLVLPELFSTGFIDDAERAASLAETSDGETMGTVADLAARHNCAVAGSMLARCGDRLYNRAFICEPRGEVTYYDKRHLFCLSEESRIVDHGDQPMPVIRFRGWNIALAVCYDIRFPVWCRNRGNAYDMLVVPANWPQRRSYAWQHLLQARAIENQAYVIGANRAGHDKYGDYDAETYIYDFMGKGISVDTGAFVTATLSMSALDAMRKSFPVWKDADDFRIIG